MARTNPGAFTVVPVARYAPGQAIHEGGVAPDLDERAVALNCNHSIANFRQQCVLNVCGNNPSSVDGYWAQTGAGYQTRGEFRCRLHAGLSELVVVVWARMGTVAATGTVRVTTSVDSVDLSVIYSAGWARYSGTLSYDPTLARETIGVALGNVSAGEIRVKSIAVWHERIDTATLAAGPSEEGLYPQDTDDVDADSTLAVWQRNEQARTAAELHRQRGGYAVSYSDDSVLRGADVRLVSGTATDYVLVARMAFRSGYGFEELEWSALGYTVGGGTAHLRMVTDRMEAEGTSPVDVTLPALGGLGWQDSTTNTLDIRPDAENRIDIYLRGDGADISCLLGLCMWEHD